MGLSLTHLPPQPSRYDVRNRKAWKEEVGGFLHPHRSPFAHSVEEMVEKELREDHARLREEKVVEELVEEMVWKETCSSHVPSCCFSVSVTFIHLCCSFSFIFLFMFFHFPSHVTSFSVLRS